MSAPAVPRAQVLDITGPLVTVLCPYCHTSHVHRLIDTRARREHRSPGCGLVRSGQDRLTGYTFTIPKTPAVRAAGRVRGTDR